MNLQKTGRIIGGSVSGGTSRIESKVEGRGEEQVSRFLWARDDTQGAYFLVSPLARGAREREIGYPEQRESWATAEFREANSSLMQIDRSRSSPAAFPLDFSFYF